ncbi:MAG TPA: flippase [Anaerolineaceae bacterium]|nr:flippase [Anaerolineaceae bacterium]
MSEKKPSEFQLHDNLHDTGDGTLPAAAPVPDIKNIQSSTSSDKTYQQNILTTAKGGSISFMGRTFEYLVRFIFSIVVARAIGAEQYGLYTLGLTIIPILSMLSLLGLQTGVVAYLAPAIRDNDEKKIWEIIQISAGIPALLSILFGVVLFFMAEPIAIQGFNDSRLIPLFQIVSVIVPMDAISFIAYQIIISYKKPQYSVLSNNVVLPVAKLLLSIGFLALGMGVNGIILAHVIASAIGFIIIIYYVNSLFSLKRPFTPTKRMTVEILKYSLPVHLGWVLNTLRGTLETIVLGFVGLISGVGIFAVAARISTLGTLLFLSVGNISTPLIAEFYNRGEMGQLERLYKTTTKWVLMFNLPLFLTFVFFSKPILSIFGADFTNGSTALIVLAVGNLVYTGTGIGANILDMTNHTKFNSINSAILIVVTITTDLLLIPRWGVIGAAAASSFSTVIVNIICLVEVYILLKIRPYGREIIKPLSAISITTVIFLLINPLLSLPTFWHLVVGGLILWSIYILILAWLGFSKEELLIFSRLRSRVTSINPFHRPVSL